MQRDSFIFYRDWADAISPLSPSERLSVYDAIIAYSFEGKAPDGLSDVVAMAMRFILLQLQRDADKYSRICERNQNNGAKGGRPKKNPNNPVGFREKPKNPNNPVALYDNDNVNDNGNVNDDDIIDTTSHDQEYIDELIQDTYWQDVMCMKLHISKDELAASLREFEENVGLDKSNHKDRADFRNHVRNWLAKRKEMKATAVNTNSVNDIWK